ncbi:MAG: 16S rRNA (guanine(966)-N(2))-methyltransferase RsmD [Candidatus Nanopelagicales bacterium]|nr:16S rRNA (guanine(966)-N(2))-methyltransferase RsmD [Candidatus Nanopelagicales bacterium]
MTRVIAGSAKGRRLKVPPSGTRPTSDRVREAMLSAVESQMGSVSGRRVMDLFAGTGALGIEALSRGAASALFVESDRACARVLGENLRNLGLTGGSVCVMRVDKLTGMAAGEPVDLVFADPPYDTDPAELSAQIGRLALGGWLNSPCLVVVEGSARWADWSWPSSVRPLRERRYGQTRVWYGLTGTPQVQEGAEPTW